MLRTHTCGELRKEQINERVMLAGWVNAVRPHGNVTFVDLRDRYGITQCVFDKSFKEQATKIKKESVLLVKGIVAGRVQVNKDIKTGDIEINSLDFEFLSHSDELPIDLAEETTSDEDTRLKFRYLDLRREKMRNNIVKRHHIIKYIRDFYDKHDFVEVETPVLAKSTPEGARDYLVPSRVHKGKFFALPQSPQLFKQLLMVSGMDKYYQIVKCFRDEDLRADRQPEFTQIDVEMSFVNEEDIYALHEELMASLFKKILKADIEKPFSRLTHGQAMNLYGSDKPDLRFGMKLKNLSDVVKNSEFKVFSDTIKEGGSVRGLVAEGCGDYSRKQIDELTEVAKTYDAKGLVTLKLVDKEKLDGPAAKFLDEKTQKNIIESLKAKKGDLILIVADKKHHVAQIVLGQLRLHLGKELNLIKDSYEFCWVTDFPLVEYDEEEKRHVAVHHPFTSPKNDDIRHLPKHPEKAYARAYDLVLNGAEVAGGSIRIHQRNVQEKMFEALGISEEEAKAKFGFLLNAFKYGPPPHGGIAFGLDRLVAIMTGNDSIREVIAFPKNKHCVSLLDDAPNVVDAKQLDELGIELKK